MQPMTADVLARLNALDILTHTGIQVTVAADGVATARVSTIMPHHLDSGDAARINDVVIMGVLDCALVAPAILVTGGERCATVESAIKLLDRLPAAPFQAVGQITGRQGDLFTVSVRVEDDTGRVAATGTGIVARL